MMRADILVIDDEPGIRDLLVYELGAQGYRVVAAANGEEGLAALRRGRFSLVISDVRMPKLGGLELLDQVKAISPEVEVILATGYGSIETAVSAMKRGAYDFISKPFNIEELLTLIDKALEKNELKAVVALHEASQALYRSVNIDEVLPVIADLACRLVKADTAGLFIIEDGKPRLAAGSAPISESLWNEPMLSASALSHPLVVAGETLGALTAHRAEGAGHFRPANLQHLGIFAAQAAQAVHNTRLYRKLQETQNRLIDSERHNAIGAFAAGVAHELNNPLTGIICSAELLAESMDPTPEQKQDLDCIIERSERCRRLGQEILQFARRRDTKPEKTGVDSLLDGSIRLCRFELPADVEIIKDLPVSPLQVDVDPIQMKQVFVNLIRNAGQAMSSSAVKRVILGVEPAARSVRIAVTDTGKGVPEGAEDRLFESFFTTKPEGEGTGLGLSISRDIVQRHGGSIRYERPVTGGSRFIVELPA